MSSSRSRSSNPRKIKRQKKTSVCSDCCSDKSEKNYLDSKCKKYFVDKKLNLLGFNYSEIFEIHQNVFIIK